MTAPETKRCTRCGQDKPLSAFGRVRADRDWLRSKCNGCEAERYRARRKGTHR